jgi:hypothetical protein
MTINLGLVGQSQDNTISVSFQKYLNIKLLQPAILLVITTILNSAGNQTDTIAIVDNFHVTSI